MTRRKINLMLLASSLEIGGAETVIDNLCRLIDRDRFNVTVCHLKQRGVVGDELLRQGYDITGLNCRDHLKPDYFSSLKLRKIITSKNIDVVHSHTTYSLIDSSLCALSINGLKLVHTFHFGNYPDYIKKYLLMEKLFWRVPDKLVAVGHEQRKKLQSTFGIPDHRIVTCWNGVNVNNGKAASIRDELRSRHAGKIIIGSISTLIEQKGIPQLLEIAAALKKTRKNFVVLVVGDGHLRKNLEEMSKSLGVEDVVEFTGFIKGAAETVLPVFDIFIQTSLWEAMSMVILEAMACSKPVIATDVGDNGHVIADGVTGLLCPRDARKMLAALELLVRRPELRVRMGAQARARYLKEFSSETMTRNYEKLYAEACGAG